MCHNSAAICGIATEIAIIVHSLNRTRCLQARGTIYERQHLVKAATEFMTSKGMGDRSSVVAGDFFTGELPYCHAPHASWCIHLPAAHHDAATP